VKNKKLANPRRHNRDFFPNPISLMKTNEIRIQNMNTITQSKRENIGLTTNTDRSREEKSKLDCVKVLVSTMYGAKGPLANLAMIVSKPRDHVKVDKNATIKIEMAIASSSPKRFFSFTFVCRILLL
jgi:ribosome recycling factor